VEHHPSSSSSSEINLCCLLDLLEDEATEDRSKAKSVDLVRFSFLLQVFDELSERWRTIISLTFSEKRNANCKARRDVYH